MADNTPLNVGSGGDTIRDVDKGGAKTQVVLLDIGGAGAEALFTGAVTITSGTVIVTGVATAARQDTGNVSLASIDSRLAGTITIGGAVTQSGAWTTGRTWTLSSGTDSVAVTGSITANAGTNLNTSALALEAGGNLATIAGKDFATQTTLALVKAKTDNLDVALSTRALEAGGNLASVKTNTDPLVAAAAGGYVRQDSTGTIAKETGGNLATLAAKDYATQATLALLYALLNVVQGADGTSTPGPMVQGVVNDSVENYIPGQVQPISLTPAGRLRVSTLPSATYLNFFDDPDQGGPNPSTDPFGFKAGPPSSIFFG